MYNQYNPEAKHCLPLLESAVKVFKLFLYSEEISKGSIRSYVSDVRHFLSWLFLFLEENHQFSLLHLQSLSSPTDHLSSVVSLLKHVNPKVLDSYRDYQVSNNVPLKTINRRFSSLRRFGLFCQSQDWSSLNPFETLKNISLNQPFQEDKYHLAEYKGELWKKGANKLTIKNYLSDIKQFLAWVDSHGLKTDFRGSASVGQISVNPPVIRVNHK